MAGGHVMLQAERKGRIVGFHSCRRGLEGVIREQIKPRAGQIHHIVKALMRGAAVVAFQIIVDQHFPIGGAIIAVTQRRAVFSHQRAYIGAGP